jgi:ubiquinone/menaquinone biosynthesis C-methylase UbiE
MKIYDKKAAESIELSYQTPEIINQRIRTLAALALNAGESVLDAGCGTGLLLEMQAKAVDHEGRAEGVDFSEDMLDVARARCAGFEQVSLQQGSVELLDFASETFDALSCTQTLLYVKEMDRALQEMYRVLKNRGRIAIVETDWDGAILNSGYPALTRKIFDAWDAAVVNPNLPRRLKPLLAGIGFSAIQVEAIPVLNASYSKFSFSHGMLGNFAKAAIKQKVITVEESETWLQDIEKLARNEAYFFCVNRYLFSAVKLGT